MNKRKQEVVCDECQGSFEVGDIKMRQKPVFDGATYEVYYNCPHCGVKYKTCYINKILLRITAKLKKAEKKKDVPMIKTLKKRYTMEFERLNKSMVESKH